MPTFSCGDITIGILLAIIILAKLPIQMLLALEFFLKSLQDYQFGKLQCQLNLILILIQLYFAHVKYVAVTFIMKPVTFITSVKRDAAFIICPLGMYSIRS
ncbi:hypothetical protein A8A01_15230 [Ewingella americana]|nr:hypothetical protein A8A01_15230 [Ewingella americana]